MHAECPHQVFYCYEVRENKIVLVCGSMRAKGLLQYDVGNGQGRILTSIKKI